MKPYYQDEAVTIYHGDCFALLPELTHEAALVTDPPYGIGATTLNRSKKRSRLTLAHDYAPVHGDDQQFDPAPFLRFPEVVLFGANHYGEMPPASRWLIWDKREGLSSNDSADCELAWTNLKGPARTFRHRWQGMLRDSEKGENWHPTQKPVALMRWVLGFTTLPLVIDPFMGAGSTLRAAKDLGRRAVGVDVEERYCEVAAKRMGQEVLAV